ncbi:hypothetical protein FJZ31_03655 [Candidatus Poribacteria bacterium]|nr:hypothetical protein [Candidatus Poribacteria bacterium]
MAISAYVTPTKSLVRGLIIWYPCLFAPEEPIWILRQVDYVNKTAALRNWNQWSDAFKQTMYENQETIIVDAKLRPVIIFGHNTDLANKGNKGKFWRKWK